MMSHACSIWEAQWMPLMHDHLAADVAQVPEKFETGRKSTACLLEDIGFPEAREELTVEGVERALAEDPKLADLWFQRGQDQRLAGGWGLECDGDRYVIHCYGGDENLVVKDRLRACAEFVVRYTKFIGDVQERTAN